MTDKDGFYTGVGLLSQLDANKQTPTIYISDLTRSRGKTKYFLCLSMRKGKKDGFVTLPYRSRIDLINAGGALCDFAKLWFPNSKCDYHFKHNDYIGKFYMDGKLTLATVALRYSVALKNFGALLSQTSAFFFDELQPEDGNYLPDEYNKFKSIYMTAARAKGQRFRPIPVYVATNPYTLFNPYYQAWGVVEKVNLKSQYVRGNGWVLEQYDDPAYAAAVSDNPVISASYAKYGQENVYLHEEKCVLPRLPDGSNYLLNISNGELTLGLYQMRDGLLWLTNKPDLTRKTVLLYPDITSNTHRLIKQYVNRGAVRFKNLQTRALLAKFI